MTDGIDAITRASLSMALDAAMLRQQAISSNIANINTDGYVPKRVNFADHVSAAREQLATEGQLSEATVEVMLQEPPQLEDVVGVGGLPAPIHLDSEVAQMAQNALHYQTLLKGLSRQMSILSIAVADGKR